METGERELLRGKLAGIFNKQSIVLTNNRLITEEGSIHLDDILEVYAEQERLKSKLVVRLKDGGQREYTIIPERIGSTLTLLSGDMGGMESEMRANSKAAIDRWVNQINRLLTDISKRAPDRGIVSNSRYWICPNCKTLNLHDLEICERCKRPNPNVPVSPPVVGRRKFCRYCGAESEDDAVFCENCGKQIGKTLQQPVKDPAEDANTARLKAREQTEKVARETAKSAVLDPSLVKRFSKKFLNPEKALRGLIENKMREGKTWEQAIKEIEEEHGNE